MIQAKNTQQLNAQGWKCREERSSVPHIAQRTAQQYQPQSFQLSSGLYLTKLDKQNSVLLAGQGLQIRCAGGGVGRQHLGQSSGTAQGIPIRAAPRSTTPLFNLSMGTYSSVALHQVSCARTWNHLPIQKTAMINLWFPHDDRHPPHPGEEQPKAPGELRHRHLVSHQFPCQPTSTSTPRAFQNE